MNDNKDKNCTFPKIIAGLILYTFFLIAIFTANFSVMEISKDVGDWGSAGDYFGGFLNPVLAFLSFIGVLWTLKMSRDELAETRSVMKEQLKTQSLQQFDSQYQHFIIQLNILLDKVGLDESVKWVDFTDKSLKSFDESYHSIGSNQSIINYRAYLVLVLKQIDQAKIDDKDKQLYVEMITAPFADKILIALHISFHCLLVMEQDEILDKNLHRILAKYNFFKNLKLLNFKKADYTYNSIGLTKALGVELYKNNHDFKEILQSTMYTDVRDYFSKRQFSVYVEGLFKRFSIGDWNMKIYFQSPNILKVDSCEELRIFEIDCGAMLIEYDSLSITSLENSSLDLIIRLGAERAELSLDGVIYYLEVVRKST